MESRSGSSVRFGDWHGSPAVIKTSPRDARAERELAVYDELVLPVRRPTLHHRIETPTEITLVLERLTAPVWDEARWLALADLLARLHAYRPEDVERWTWTDPGEPVEVDALWLDDHDVLDPLDREVLWTAVGPDRVFSHGDCHLANVLTDDVGTLVLIDWQSARFAPEGADLAFALTRAVPTGVVIPRRLVIDRYAARRDLDPDAFDRAVTAQQLLTLVWQYPAFAGYLSAIERDRLRVALRELTDRWLDRDVSGPG